MEEADSGLSHGDVVEKTELKKMIGTACSRIGSNISWSNYDDLLVEINRRKEYHYFLSRVFNDFNYTSVICEMHKCKYGSAVSYSYDRTFDAFTIGAKTLLSLIIAERFILFKKSLFKHATVTITGLSGSGKTTYSISSIAGALKILGFSDNEIESILSRVVFFESRNFVEFVNYCLENRVWVPVVLVDDVGSQISKYWVWLGEKWWAYLFSVLDHIKDWCGVLLLTATNLSGIPSRIREKVDLVVEASEVTYKGYVFNLFKWYRNTGRSNREMIYIDVFPPTTFMPSSLWRKMMEGRRELGLKRLNKLQEVLNKANVGGEKEEESEGGDGGEGEDDNR